MSPRRDSTQHRNLTDTFDNGSMVIDIVSTTSWPCASNQQSLAPETWPFPGSHLPNPWMLDAS